MRSKCLVIFLPQSPVLPLRMPTLKTEIRKLNSCSSAAITWAIRDAMSTNTKADDVLSEKRQSEIAECRPAD